MSALGPLLCTIEHPFLRVLMEKWGIHSQNGIYAIQVKDMKAEQGCFSAAPWVPHTSTVPNTLLLTHQLVSLSKQAGILPEGRQTEGQGLRRQACFSRYTVKSPRAQASRSYPSPTAVPVRDISLSLLPVLLLREGCCGIAQTTGSSL